LSQNGHDILVISGGGKLEKQLKNVQKWNLPVYQKNPFTVLYSALEISKRAKKEGWDLVHAHSRVPIWIAWWVSSFSGIPFIFTAHDCYSTNFGIFPFKSAKAAISVSYSVEDHLKDYLPSIKVVIYNGLSLNNLSWGNNNTSSLKKLLFVGRLTRRKGLQVLLESLRSLSINNWVLDVVGDGPMKDELKKLTAGYGLESKVLFHGFSDKPDSWMENCSCFLFPSLSEGMGLTLMRAIQMGVPVIASDLPPVRELTDRPDSLVPPGNVEKWRLALEVFLRNGKVSEGFKKDRILSVSQMAERIEREVYLPLLKERRRL